MSFADIILSVYLKKPKIRVYTPCGYDFFFLTLSRYFYLVTSYIVSKYFDRIDEVLEVPECRQYKNEFERILKLIEESSRECQRNPFCANTATQVMIKLQYYPVSAVDIVCSLIEVRFTNMPVEGKGHQVIITTKDIEPPENSSVIVVVPDKGLADITVFDRLSVLEFAYILDGIFASWNRYILPYLVYRSNLSCYEKYLLAISEAPPTVSEELMYDWIVMSKVAEIVEQAEDKQTAIKYLIKSTEGKEYQVLVLLVLLYFAVKYSLKEESDEIVEKLKLLIGAELAEKIKKTVVLYLNKLTVELELPQAPEEIKEEKAEEERVEEIEEKTEEEVKEVQKEEIEKLTEEKRTAEEQKTEEAEAEEIEEIEIPEEEISKLKEAISAKVLKIKMYESSRKVPQFKVTFNKPTEELNLVLS